MLYNNLVIKVKIIANIFIFTLRGTIYIYVTNKGYKTTLLAYVCNKRMDKKKKMCYIYM